MTDVSLVKAKPNLQNTSYYLIDNVVCILIVST